MWVRGRYNLLKPRERNINLKTFLGLDGAASVVVTTSCLGAGSTDGYIQNQNAQVRSVDPWWLTPKFGAQILLKKTVGG